MNYQLLFHVYGDSLSLPRPEDGIPFIHTYPELIRCAFEQLQPKSKVYIYNRSMGGATIKSLFNIFIQDYDVGGECQNVLIIQSGIVDCAPRPIPALLRTVLSHLPIRVRSRIVKFLHEHRRIILRCGFSWRYTSPAVFKATLSSWLVRAAPNFRRIYVINIPPTMQVMEDHSPGLSASIELYNNIIEQVVKSVGVTHVHLVNVYHTIQKHPDDVALYINPKDGHHITLKSHYLYSEMVMQLETARMREEGHEICD